MAPPSHNPSERNPSAPRLAPESHAYPYPRTRVVLALTISLPLITTGCGLPVGPNHRLLLGYQATTPDASSLRTVIPGIDLRLHSEHNGLNIGWSSTTVSKPVPGSPSTNAPIETVPAAPAYRPPLAVAWSRNGIQHILGWQVVKELRLQPGTPCLIDAQQAGLTLASNPHLTDIGLSISRHTFLLVPPDHDGTLKARISPGDMPRFHSNK